MEADREALEALALTNTWRDSPDRVGGSGAQTDNISTQPQRGPGITDRLRAPSHFRAFSFQTFQSIKLSSEKNDVTQMRSSRKLQTKIYFFHFVSLESLVYSTVIGP